MSDILEFRHLKYIVAVAEEANFTRAAERLFLAQPSLSKQIKDLEDVIGFPIFVRTRDGARITPGGQMMIQYAQEALLARKPAWTDHRALPGRPGVQLEHSTVARGFDMSNHAANPAALTRLSLKSVRGANPSLKTSNDDDNSRSSFGVRSRARVAANLVGFLDRDQDENFRPEGVCRFVSRRLLGHGFGAFPAPCGTWSSASLSAPPWGPGSSRNKFENRGRLRRSIFFRAPPGKQTFGAWEPGPFAWLRPV
jgi:hypothetical protein